MTENYAVTLEITPEMEEWAEGVVQTHDDYGNFPDRWRSVPTIAKAILDAKPKPPDLLKQAFAIVCPSSYVDQWSGPLTAIGAMSVWIFEHHNGRSHGYLLMPDWKWESWFVESEDDYQAETFDTQQEAMAWLVVRMHREDTNA